MTDRANDSENWTVSFVANGITPYLRSRLQADGDGRITVGQWSTILGVVPLRWVQRRILRSEVTEVHIARRVHPDRLVAAGLLAGVAVLTGGHRPLRWVAAVLAFAMVPVAIVAVLRIEHRGGEPLDAPICLLMIPRARRAAASLLALTSSVESDGRPAQEVGSP